MSRKNRGKVGRKMAYGITVLPDPSPPFPKTLSGSFTNTLLLPTNLVVSAELPRIAVVQTVPLTIYSSSLAFAPS